MHTCASEPDEVCRTRCVLDIASTYVHTLYIHLSNLMALQMELIALLDEHFPTKEGIVEKFRAVISSPSSWDLFLGRCPLLCDKNYRITQIAREHHVGVVFHLSHSVFGLDYKMEYVLPPQYAQPITDEDVEEVNSGRAEYTLRKQFVKDDRESSCSIRETLCGVSCMSLNRRHSSSRCRYS